MNWTDESTEPVYVNWSAGEPVYEDDQNDCAYFSVSSGTWNTKHCEELLDLSVKAHKLVIEIINEQGDQIGISAKLVMDDVTIPDPYSLKLDWT